MSLYRANDRLPEDETILLINAPDAFALFRERSKLGIKGIAYDVIFSDALKTSLLNCADMMMREDYEGSIPQISFYPRLTDPIFPRLKEKFQKYALPEEFFDLLKMLILCRENALDKKSSGGHLRVNSDYPRIFHTHQPVLSLSFNQAGTAFLTPQLNKITVPTGRAIILDENVEHKAPYIPKELLKDSPRINLILR